MGFAKWKAVVLLVLLAALFSILPIERQISSQAAMDSVTQRGVKLPIIMYHSVLADARRSDTYIITPQALKDDLKYLQKNGFETVVVADLIAYVNGRGELPEKPVMLTFDDGHYNVLYYVLPMLKEMGMKAVLSVVGSYADAYTKNPDPNPNYAYLSWDEIKQMHESGFFEIQNHSYAMHSIGERRGSQRILGESEVAYCSTFLSDVLKQQTLLQTHCGVIATAYTYPFGLISPEAQECLLQANLSASLICSERINWIQAGNPGSLFDLGRFNRSGKVSTASFMKRLMRELSRQ